MKPRPARADRAAAPPSLAELRRLVRASAVFDAAQKRAWTDVLPHLAPAHRAELLAILLLEHEPEGGAVEARRGTSPGPAEAGRMSPGDSGAILHPAAGGEGLEPSRRA